MIRLALVGLGHMGQKWKRIAWASPRVHLVATVDPVAADATHRSLDAAPPFDAAIVAASTVAHHDVAVALIARGVDVLVEKPLAATYRGAGHLVALARAHGVALAVGHVERFNSALVALRGVIARGEIGEVRAVEAMRVGPMPHPGADAILDLAVHDLDLVRLILGPLRIADVDMGAVHLVGAHGRAASVHVGWDNRKARSLFVSGSLGAVRADLLAGTCARVERGHATPVDVPPGDALSAQLSAFLDLVEGRDAGPLCSGEDGAEAVRLCEEAIALRDAT